MLFWNVERRMIVIGSEYLILESGEKDDCDWIRVSYFGVWREG